MSELEIINSVARHLEEHQPPDYRIELSRDNIRHEDDWWYLVVHPSKTGIRASEYTRRLEQIENEIEKEHGVKVLLVPTIED